MDQYTGFQDNFNDESLNQYYEDLEKYDNQFINKVDDVYEIINKKLSEIRPNYGYNEKYDVAYGIIALNGFLMPKMSEIFDLMEEIVNKNE